MGGSRRVDERAGGLGAAGEQKSGLWLLVDEVGVLL